MQINRLNNQYDNGDWNNPGIMPGQPGHAEDRLKSGNRTGGVIAAGGGRDDITGISFDHEDHNRFLGILGAPYSAQDDGHGKFTPAPRTEWPRTDHGAPGDNKRKKVEHASQA